MVTGSYCSDPDQWQNYCIDMPVLKYCCYLATDPWIGLDLFSSFIIHYHTRLYMVSASDDDMSNQVYLSLFRDGAVSL